VASARHTRYRGGATHTDNNNELDEQGHQDRPCPFSASALSENNSKSACAFPVISNANLVRANSASSFALRVRNRSSSTKSGDRFDRREAGTPPVLSAVAPSSSRRHTEI